MAESDQELVARCQKGDRQAFEGLVRKYQRRVYAVACGMLHNSEEAEDVAQDAFVKAYKYIGHFKGTSSFYTWLYRIAVNLCIDRLRKSSKAPTLEYDDRLRRPEGAQAGSELEPSTIGTNPDKELRRKELAGQIQTGLNRLTPKHRAVLILREIEGLSYKEMAEVMRCSKGTIMSRLFHARRKLQQYLREYLGDQDLSI